MKVEMEFEHDFDEEYLRERLWQFRYWFMDEIPQEFVHSSDPENRYKVRASWTISLTIDIQIARNLGLIPPAAISDVNDYLKWYDKVFKHTKWSEPVTREYIEKGNNVIDSILRNIPVKPLTPGSLG